MGRVARIKSSEKKRTDGENDKVESNTVLKHLMGVFFALYHLQKHKEASPSLSPNKCASPIGSIPRKVLNQNRGDH